MKTEAEEGQSPQTWTFPNATLPTRFHMEYPGIEADAMQ